MAQVAEESRLDSVLLINSIAHVGAAAGAECYKSLFE